MARKKKTVEYIAKTPNPSYHGKVAGVRFFDGKALISEHMIDKLLGWSVEDVVKKLVNDFGYEVKEAE